jgi:hypothetical protein
VFRELAKLVKDRDAFIVDFFSMIPPKDKKGPFEDMVGANPMLKDVKIDGDNAKGVLTGTQDGMEVSTPLEFKKQGGSWKIEMPMPGGKKKGPKKG